MSTKPILRTSRFVAHGLLAVASFANSAAAQELASKPKPFTYVLSVGSNEGGEGQEKLRYAEEDAARIAQTFRELGSYGQSDFRVLKHPTGTEVVAAVDDIRSKLQAHKAKGEEAVFLFYYSGHARANALNVGKDELPLGLLRERLLSMPATLTLVMLDACQSGAFARSKGAEGAADFSYNSVTRLRTKGVAVLASSAANELSQESDDLKSSYFTSAVISGLRGAADSDGDGKVSLGEAYQYAYRRTLAATTRTQVGGQHATLETDLSGLGEVALTYPRDARAKLELPDALEGRVLVQQKATGAIAAEVYKAKGAPVRIALVAGVYEIVVRPSVGASLGCQSRLDDNVTTLWSANDCTQIKDAPGKKKGDDDGERLVDPWSVEAAIGLAQLHDDSAYFERLRDFGYSERALIRLGHGRVEVRFGRELARNFSLSGQGTFTFGDEVRRTAGGGTDTHSYDALGFGAVARGFVRPWPSLELYAQGTVGLGLGIGTTNIAAAGGSTHVTAGPVVGATAGLSVGTTFFVTTRFGYEFSPVLRNLFGDTHNTGGLHGMLGFGYKFGGE